MEKVSKNIYKGEQITDLREIQRLAIEQKSVIWKAGNRYFVRPASFFLGWQLKMMINGKFYYSIKVEK